jgi:hypothetical protein
MSNLFGLKTRGEMNKELKVRRIEFRKIAMSESVFVLHPFLFWALMVFAVIGLIVVAWNIFKLYGVDVL